VSDGSAKVLPVKYGDPVEDWSRDISDLKLTKLATRKRKVYQYENEVRVLMKKREPTAEKGEAIPWDAETVLKSIRAHPSGDESLIEAVQGVVEHHAPKLQSSVMWSSMRLKPPC
jgi:hypothetical protein